MTEGKGFTGHVGDDKPFVRLTAPIGFGELDREKLIRLLVNGLLGLAPALIRTHVYLVDETDPLVFVPADGPAAAVYAPRGARLRALYESAGEWLLDADRAAIGR